MIDQLQGKVKSYKKQIEEAEEIAALNLAKFRQVQLHSQFSIVWHSQLKSSSVQVQANLAGSIERADLNEQALAKARARGRSASMGPL